MLLSWLLGKQPALQVGKRGSIPRRSLLLSILLSTQALAMGFFDFHTPVCDEAHYRLLPFMNVRVIMTVVVDGERETAEGVLMGAAETPYHVMRVFIGYDRVLTYPVTVIPQIDSIGDSLVEFDGAGRNRPTADVQDSRGAID
jgi:hypothetical protein